MADEEESELHCGACGGMLVVMGQLGKRKHARCRNCGLDSSQVLPEPFRYLSTDPRSPALIQRETIESIDRYVNAGIPPGDFLEAILSNDLMEACKRADEDNLHAIVAIAQHVYSHVPMNCHGTRGIVTAWIALSHAMRKSATEDEIATLTTKLYDELGKKGS